MAKNIVLCYVIGNILDRYFPNNLQSIVVLQCHSSFPKCHNLLPSIDMSQVLFVNFGFKNNLPT